MPLEYGGQRTPSAQWTSTASGAFVLSCDEKYRTSNEILIKEIMIGKIIDGSISDASNMGAAMAFAAADTIISYFNESGESVSNFDHIVTGDLGKVGSEMLKEILAKEGSGLESIHTDCGLLLYDEKKQDVHSGASGCGTSASVLAAHFLPLLESGKLRRIIFLSTGALMNPSILLQGESILGIAPLIRIEGKK
jgi:stage V sporulation protein AD